MNERSGLRKTPSTPLVEEDFASTKTKAKVTASKSLRDEFAMSALDHATSIYTKMTVMEVDRLMGRKNHSKDQAIARLAYNMADAMLAAREV